MSACHIRDSGLATATNIMEDINYNRQLVDTCPLLCSHRWANHVTLVIDDAFLSLDAHQGTTFCIVPFPPLNLTVSHLFLLKTKLSIRLQFSCFHSILFRFWSFSDPMRFLVCVCLYVCEWQTRADERVPVSFTLYWLIPYIQTKGGQWVPKIRDLWH